MCCSQQSRDFSNTNPCSVDIRCCEEKTEDSGMHDAQRTSRKQQPTLTPRTKIPTYTPAANNDPSCSVSRCQPSAVCMPTTRLQTARCRGQESRRVWRAEGTSHNLSCSSPQKPEAKSPREEQWQTAPLHHSILFLQGSGLPRCQTSTRLPTGACTNQWNNCSTSLLTGYWWTGTPRALPARDWDSPVTSLAAHNRHGTIPLAMAQFTLSPETGLQCQQSIFHYLHQLRPLVCFQLGHSDIGLQSSHIVCRRLGIPSRYMQGVKTHYVTAHNRTPPLTVLVCLTITLAAALTRTMQCGSSFCQFHNDQSNPNRHITKLDRLSNV